ncbi:MAG: hypothetical protein MJY93_01485 [Fibrobacter sp.]|nr:hypothetical protein [Fibrobacter sp.]
MYIKILDTIKCKKCNKKTCARNDVITRNNLSTDRDTCPIKFISNEPSNEQLQQGYIDVKIPPKEKRMGCLYCGLCVKKCSKQNLEFEADATISVTTQMPQDMIQANNVANVIAMSYLNSLFDFAANTNLNKNLRFDGYISNENGEECFVETDINNDSLECCRRLIGNLISYNSRNTVNKIECGLIVLEKLPKKGTNDVYALVEKLRQFPTTSYYKIYFTTLSILQYFFNRYEKNQHELLEMFFLMAEESREKYVERLLRNNLINECDTGLFK